MHHAHFAGEQADEMLGACFGLVEGVLNERIVSVVLYQGGYPYVSDFCHIEDPPAVKEASRPRRELGWFRRLLGFGREPGDPGSQTTWRSYGPVHYVLGPPPPGPRHLQVHSWLGGHDGRTRLT